MKTFTDELKMDGKLETCYEAGDLSSDEIKLMLALTLVPGIGPASFKKLMEAFGSAEAIFSRRDSELREVYPQIKKESLEAILNGPDLRAVKHQEELCLRHGVEMISSRSPFYPAPLLTLANPVPFLFMQGRWLAEDAQSVALVGTRYPTAYGSKMANEIGLGLAELGFTIVSGLARGIDTVVHSAALNGGGRTIAVLGSGLDWIYPNENIPLAEKIVGRGCLISEFPMGTAPHATHFPRRNRFISALSLGTVVVEAGTDSGALITSEFAMEQGREVFAVPGMVQNPGSRGPHKLIQAGAHLVQSAEDIVSVLEGLSQAVPARRTSVRSNLTYKVTPNVIHKVTQTLPVTNTLRSESSTSSASHTSSVKTGRVTKEVQVALKLPETSKLGLESESRDLMSLLGGEALSLEVIMVKAREKQSLRNAPIHRLLTGLLELELRGKVKRLPGGLFRRA